MPAVVAGGIGLVIASAAQAHSFYSLSCCHDRDCYPIPFGAVEITPEGYLLKPTEELIPFGDARIRDTPPDDTGRGYHLCTTTGGWDGMVLCFYAPRDGS